MSRMRVTPFRLLLVVQAMGFLLVAVAASVGAAAAPWAGGLAAAVGAALFASGLYASSRHLQSRIDALTDALLAARQEIGKVREDLHLTIHLSQATDAAGRRAVAEDYARRHADMATIFEDPNQARRRQLLLEGSCGRTALEVGCSTGAIAGYFRDEGYRAVGTDLSRHALTLGVPGVPYVQSDAYRLPFGDGSFDTVILPEVLEHLEDPVAALREAVRVASQRVAVSIPLGPMCDPTHCRIYTRETALELFTQVPGLAVIRTDDLAPWVIVTCERREAASTTGRGRAPGGASHSR